MRLFFHRRMFFLLVPYPFELLKYDCECDISLLKYIICVQHILLFTIRSVKSYFIITMI